jgi:hypothetical protein
MKEKLKYLNLFPKNLFNWTVWKQENETEQIYILGV